MASKTIRIELKVNYKDPALLDNIIKAAREYARELYTAAILISDGNPPQCVLLTEGAFEPARRIDIAGEDNTDAYPNS